jgi:hypothetical protein
MPGRPDNGYTSLGEEIGMYVPADRQTEKAKSRINVEAARAMGVEEEV